METQIRTLTRTMSDTTEQHRVDHLSREFRQQVKNRQEDHSLYALTLSSRESFVRNNIGWWNTDARERFIEGLFSLLIHRVSSRCCSNYRRDTHQDRRILSLGFIEHIAREPKLVPVTDGNGQVVFIKGTRKPLMKKVFPRVSPHIHATLAVHNQWEDQFESCFQRELCRDHCSVRPEVFSGNALTRWDEQVQSLRLELIPTNNDQFRWISYSSKQIPTDLTDGCSFLHQGIRRRTDNASL